MQREPWFSTVQVAPDFSRQDYADTFAALQRPTCSKVLDLVPARLLCADIFERLALAWTATTDTVPRLAIVLSFERWVMLRDTALTVLQPLARRGVRVEVFYAEQASAGYLGEWYTGDWIVHDVRAALATLAKRGRPVASWKIVIDALARLTRSHASPHELPARLTEIAALALSSGGAVEAETLAREALLYLPESSSPTRSQVLRELGTALLCQGQSAAGLALLDQAFTMAMKVDAPDVGASALYHSGLCALSHGDYRGVEQRFRRAIELLRPPIARSFPGAEGAEQAAQHAHAALSWIGDQPSPTRCRALRAAAAARLSLGQAEAGLMLLETAITTAAVLRDPIEEASALAEIGFHALRRGHAARAEARFRAALDLLPAEGPRYLRATVHHDLALALHVQRKDADEAERHATTALGLRWDQGSQLAREDRALLALICARRS